MPEQRWKPLRPVRQSLRIINGATFIRFCNFIPPSLLSLSLSFSLSLSLSFLFLSTVHAQTQTDGNTVQKDWNYQLK
jgi:hypothetical protein